MTMRILCLMLCCLAFMRGLGQESQLALADPFILVEDGVYYAYGTHSAEGIECYSSPDLVNWTFRGLALHRRNTTERRWFWAPEVYHIGSTYYMYYSANEHLYVATAKEPTGPFRQVGGAQMAPVLGEERCIDSSVFFDRDGTPWLFFVRFDDGNCIWQCRLADDLVTPLPATLRKCFGVTAPWENIWPRVTEGPNVLYHRGRYYLTYSANSYESQDYAVGYATARSIEGPWKKYKGNPILRRRDGLVGTGHHSLFRDREGQLRIVFHAHNSTARIHPRLAYIGTARFRGRRLSITDDALILPRLE